ncbi:MAG: hypothetical protein H6829_04695, partial [Planctomycetes bacterium]|nr:hypothetical protein [Planctomycetota bacterium]
MPLLQPRSQPRPTGTGRSGPRSGLAALVGALVGWSPVWIPLILMWQFADRGLRPALAERQRLHQLAPQVEAEHQDSEQAFEVLQAEAIAWQDPVYRERLRRLELLGPPEFEPLPTTNTAAQAPDPTPETAYFPVEEGLQGPQEPGMQAYVDAWVEDPEPEAPAPYREQEERSGWVEVGNDANAALMLDLPPGDLQYPRSNPGAGA